MLPVLDRYRHKLKTAAEVRGLIGPRPRAHSAIMCHGVFDVVHPGHLRHLLYAKSKAEILVASLTADRYVSKGVDRPHVPQDLRAMNLAALEAVDYVLIDDHETPIENLRLLEPDYFAKGFEYANGGSVNTDAEAAVLGSYGGELIFTPGDVVYSSSRLIALPPPRIRLAMLEMLMARHGITFDHLRRALWDMKGREIHVVGDTIIDSQTHCGLIGAQAKTPTISALFDRKLDFVGGAGVVAKHLAAAGAKVTFSTVWGDDTQADFAWEDLTRAGVSVEPIIDASRPTVNKNAILVDGYRILKIDTLDNSSIADKTLTELCAAVKDTEAEAVIFSDFRHGIFNRRTIPDLVAAAAGRFRAADSQVASRWGNIADFKGFDLITPNEREARFALGDQDSGIRPLASRLYDQAKCGLLILKLGERGVLSCSSSNHESLDSFFVMDSFADSVVDPVGAGDALLAYATLGLLTSKSAGIATILGTMAAAIECEHDGNIPVTSDDVRARLDHIEGQMA